MDHFKESGTTFVKVLLDSFQICSRAIYCATSTEWNVLCCFRGHAVETNTPSGPVFFCFVLFCYVFSCVARGRRNFSPKQTPISGGKTEQRWLGKLIHPSNCLHLRWKKCESIQEAAGRAAHHSSIRKPPKPLF